MPDAFDLAAMYGTSYGSGAAAEGLPDPKEPEWVLGWLKRLPPGSFLDYGCGRGELLVEAAKLGWKPLGVELTEEVAEKTASATALPVMPVEDAVRRGLLADVVHLGDVLEHLTDPDREMPRILSLLGRGGLLLAQGPLEANGNLFTWTIRLVRSLKRRAPISSPPYHVILATVEGQWTFFRRFGLEAIEEQVSEVSWPAPERLSLRDAVRPERGVLFALRLASRSFSRLRPGRWGNRYRYAGRHG
jgi:SAM-dependent methyltransferase